MKDNTTPDDMTLASAAEYAAKSAFMRLTMSEHLTKNSGRGLCALMDLVMGMCHQDKGAMVDVIKYLIVNDIDVNEFGEFLGVKVWEEIQEKKYGKLPVYWPKVCVHKLGGLES